LERIQTDVTSRSSLRRTADTGPAYGAAMRFRPAALLDVRNVRNMGNAGAAQNARRSLDEWARAQVEVAALVSRLNAEPEAGGGVPGASVFHRVEDTDAA
jgi:hypothetical protein